MTAPDPRESFSHDVGLGGQVARDDELVDRHQSRPGEDALVGDALVPAHQVAQQVDLQLVAGRKVAVPPFGDHHPRPGSSGTVSGREDDGLAQPGPRPQDGDQSVGIGRPVLQHLDVLGGQGQDPEGVGVEIVDQSEARDAQLLLQDPLVQTPRRFVARHWPSNAGRPPAAARRSRPVGPGNRPSAPGRGKTRSCTWLPRSRRASHPPAARRAPGRSSCPRCPRLAAARSSLLSRVSTLGPSAPWS
jgi:hypothetical protein